MNVLDKTRSRIIGLFLLTLSSTTGMLSCSQATSPEKIVLQYKEALNSHNVDSLLNIYSDDIVFSIVDLRMNLSGKHELRGVAEYDSVLNTTMVLTDISVSNDTVFCSIGETNEWMNAAGISSAFYPSCVFVVREGKIAYMEADLADSSLASFRSVFNSFLPWAKQTHPDALDSLMPEGNFQFNANSGVLYRELLLEWGNRESNN